MATMDARSSTCGGAAGGTSHSGDSPPLEDEDRVKNLDVCLGVDDRVGRLDAEHDDHVPMNVLTENTLNRSYTIDKGPTPAGAKPSSATQPHIRRVLQKQYTEEQDRGERTH